MSLWRTERIACARSSPHGAKVSPLTTISAVSSSKDKATETLSRFRDSPNARNTVSSDEAANCPSPNNTPITAAVGNKV